MTGYQQLLSATAAAVTAIVVAVITVDDRFAHADDITQYKSDMKDFLATQQKAFDNSLKAVRLATINDQIFLLKLRESDKGLSRIDSALLSRYESQKEMLQAATSDYSSAVQAELSRTPSNALFNQAELPMGLK